MSLLIDWTTIRTRLYDNSTGTNGTVTLSQSSANFNYLMIYYRNNDNFYASVKVPSPNGKKAWLSCGWIGNSTTDTSSYIMKCKTVNISGTQITNVAHKDVQIGAVVNSNNIYIVRVEGWSI